jgi:AcrR family transcriptional regulator
MDHDILTAASSIVARGESLTMESLAAELGISRSTAYRRSGGMGALRQALAEQGIDDSPTTRERILDATRRIVAIQGVARVSVEALAAEAGVGTVTVYRIFGDRSSLLREALAGVFPTAAFELLGEAAEAPLDLTLERVATAMIQFAGSYPGLMALILVPASADRAELMETQGMQGDMRAMLGRLFDAYVARGLLAPGDPVERAGAFSGLIMGASVLLHEVRPLQEGEARLRARRVVRFFLAGLGHDVSSGS